MFAAFTQETLGGYWYITDECRGYFFIYLRGYDES